MAFKESFRHNQREIIAARLGGFFYRCITVCITVLGGLGAWGGNGLELRALTKIKTARPAQAVHSIQKSKKQRKPNKKRTKWCVLKRVAFVGMPRRVQSPRFPMFQAVDLSACITLSLTVLNNLFVCFLTLGKSKHVSQIDAVNLSFN